MPIPSSGLIWLSQLRDEFGNWGPPNWLSHYYRGALTTANNPNVPTGGFIAMSQFYGAEKPTPGSWGVATPGTYYMTLPAFSTLNMYAYGAGGGGGGSTYDIGYPGSAGGAGETSIVSYAGNTIIYGGGGGGGDGSYYNQAATGYPGAAGGGDSNGAGGGSSGGAGGVYGYTQGGNGGNGGLAVRTFSYGEDGVTKGITLTIVVGNGGHGGAGQVGGNNGSAGAVYLNWA